MSNAEKFIDMLKMQALSAADLQAAKDAVSMLELFGYKAVPAIRDLLEISSNSELRNHALEILTRLGWIMPPDVSMEKDNS